MPITHKDMTRFWITLQQGVDFVFKSIERMDGGEIFVPKIPSIKITDLAKAMAPKLKIKIIGIRPGEKLHEQMIGEEDAPYTYEYDHHFKILPQINNWSTDVNRIKDGKRVPDGFVYASDSNSEWMTAEQLLSWITKNQEKIGRI
mgnify:CR=1 FL=1